MIESTFYNSQRNGRHVLRLCSAHTEHSDSVWSAMEHLRGLKIKATSTTTPCSAPLLLLSRSETNYSQILPLYKNKVYYVLASITLESSHRLRSWNKRCKYFRWSCSSSVQCLAINSLAVLFLSAFLAIAQYAIVHRA